MQVRSMPRRDLPAPRANASEEDSWRPAVRCPECYHPPTVRFTEREVQRARRDRQAARLQNVQCARCLTVYWIQARHVAAATLDKPRTAV